MKVLLDYRPALRDRTGVGEWVHQLAQHLLKLKSAAVPGTAGFELTLWTSSWRDRPTPESVAELEGATLVDRRIPVRPLTWAWNRVGWPTVEALTSRAFDIVHSTTPLLLPSRSGLRVCTIYDLDFLSHPDRTWAEMRRDYPRLARAHAARADALVTISDYSRRQIHATLGVGDDRIVVCRPGVPSWIQGPAPQNPDLARGYILFVGTLEPRKNVQGLLAAYRVLVERDPLVPRLVLAGRVTPAAAGWVAEANAPPLAGRVDVLGYVEDQQRGGLYRGARVLVLPSFDEGFGLPALEAMALGIPVVASTSGALPEVVGEAGLLVNASDIRGLADAVHAVVTDQALAARLRQNGIERAARFSWPESALALLHAYEEMAGRAGAGRSRRQGKKG
jgi:glycosyltransferase involved in cell wall biosynthesis